MASPWFELAVIVAGDKLSGGESDQLLKTYWGNANCSDEQRTQLLRYRCIYRYLEILWFDAQGLAPQRNADCSDTNRGTVSEAVIISTALQHSEEQRRLRLDQLQSDLRQL
jgi:hypothetical protein